MAEEKKAKMNCVQEEEKLCMYLLTLFVIGAVFSVFGINIDEQLRVFNGFEVLAIVSLLIIVNTVHKKREALKNKERCIGFYDIDILSAMLIFVGLISIHNRVTCEIIVLCNFVIEQLLRRFKHWQY